MIVPIVLAAGLGTRMGTSKPLLQIGDRPALAIVLDTLGQAVAERPIVVVGHQHESVVSLAERSGCVSVVNPDPGRGLSSSVRLGLDAVGPDAIGVLILHVDMPLVCASTIQAVLEKASKGAAIVAPSYQSQRGFPVYFRQDQLPALRASLQGDSGGKAFIAEHRSLLQLVPVDDPGCVRDFDTPADLEALKGELPCAIKE